MGFAVEILKYLLSEYLHVPWENNWQSVATHGHSNIFLYYNIAVVVLMSFVIFSKFGKQWEDVRADRGRGNLLEKTAERNLL